jgi:hypothetical protein
MRSVHRMSVAAVGLAAMFALSVQAHGGRIQNGSTARAESDGDEHHLPRCSVARLRGSFGFTTTGWIVFGGPVGPVADVGVLTFDGVGGVSQTETLSLNGVPGERSSAGIYSVDRDCTGEMTITHTQPAGESKSHFVIVDGGKELRSIVTGAGRVLTTIARKQ